MTAFGSIETAVQAMREGAYGYLTKPFDLDELLAQIADCAEQIRTIKQAESNARKPWRNGLFPIAFRNPAYRSLIHLVQTVSQSNVTVLITGETGTGKEIIARSIHQQSDRSNKPLVAVDANAIADNLLESELFGHAKGAFTGAEREKPGIIETAHQGTLFLDEIGNLNLAAQSKLLRFLQDRRFRRVGETRERSVDVRFLAATNKDLKRMIAEETFREDLYYRISVMHIRIPPLRERREDIAPLLYYFLRQFDPQQEIDGFRPEVLDILMDCPWPGNVRQLENAVEHAVLLRRCGYIQKRDLPEWLTAPLSEPNANSRFLETVERDHILQVLEECRGNRSRAARILGINRRTLLRKLDGYGLRTREQEPGGSPGADGKILSGQE
jgi:two-component system response regulator HydG